MAEDGTQPATQHVLDPRRIGRNTSGLREDDVSDVMCILSPGSPSAFRIIAHTATRTAQHILQNRNFDETYDFGDSLDNAQDIALRFSSNVNKPGYGFLFGRNQHSCDIILADEPSGATRRISNTHFRIYMNHNGIIMLEDISTNGTVVDGNMLVGRQRGEGASHMLENGVDIRIPAPQTEHQIIFHVRIPPRDGFEAEYLRKAEAYMRRNHAAFHRGLASEGPVRAPMIVQNRSFGMKWDGRPKYTVTAFLGKGAFANVYQLTTRAEGTHFAVKELEKRRYVKEGVLDRKLSNEMDIMKSIKHPHIVEYVEYHDFQDHLYIIMEFVPHGDLQAYLKHGLLSEPNAILVARQTLLALDYLHGKNITHRDIKPDNILIASENPLIIKLSDFGLSKVKKDDTFLKTFCGTLLYCAPEVFPHYQNAGTKRRHNSKSYSYTHAVDIWSLAGVLWYALCGFPPFEGVVDPTGRGMFEKIMYTPLDTAALRKVGISKTAEDLLKQMLRTEPERRPSARKCLQHPWLNGGSLSLDAAVIDEDGEQSRQFSQLSLQESDAGPGSSFPRFEDIPEEDEEFDEIEQIDFGISRSKRVKTDSRFPRNQMRATSEPESSDDLSGADPTPVPRITGQFSEAAGAERLFGEIGESALADSGVLGEHAKVALERDPRPHPQNQSESQDHVVVPGTQHLDASHSLFGTESLVRDLNMQSPPCSDSFSSPESSLNSYRDPPEPPNRQIVSFNSEETPRVVESKHESPVDVTPTRAPRNPIPDTTYASAVSIGQSLPIAAVTPKPTPSDVAAHWERNPPRYGTLVTTSDSKQSYHLPINKRYVQYGRFGHCTLIYPHSQDTRVSRVSFCLAFHAAAIESVEAAGGDWTTLPDLHVLIKNFSKTTRIWVNETAIEPMRDDGVDCTGRVYTGDVITVFQPPDGEEGEKLRFVCNFFYGAAKECRTERFQKQVMFFRLQSKIEAANE
jgi:serine/threonine protein kinase